MIELSCSKDKIIEHCPICNAISSDKETQPQAGTHVFTIIYACGTEIDYPIGHEGVSLGKTCDNTITRFVLPTRSSDN